MTCLENARITSNGLGERVPRYIRELRVDVFDVAIPIGDDDGGRTLLDRLKELAEVCLRFLLLGDLPGIDRHFGNRTVRLHRIEPELEPARTDRYIAVRQRPCRGDLSDDRHPQFRLVRRQQPIEPEAHGIRPARPSRQTAFGGLIDGKNLAADGHQQDFVLARVQQRTHADFAVVQGPCVSLQRFFCLLAPADILNDADGVGRIAIVVALGGSCQVYPDGVAILAHVALLHLEGIDVSTHEGSKLLQVGRKIFRICQILKTLLDKLGAAVPEDVAQTLIYPQPGAVDSDVGNADGGVFECPAKPGFAFPQRVLRPLALGDVEVEADPRGDAILVAHRPSQAKDGAPGAVLALDAMLPRPIGAAAHALPPGNERRLHIRGRQPVEPAARLNVVKRLADKIEE